MSKNPPLAALLTDFGTSDHYAAAMKGAMLCACPDLSIVDITHQIEPQNIPQAAYMLWAAYRSFPDDTVFCCVVDPGVGTSRDIIIAQSNRHVFVAPRNGLLDFVLWTEETESVIVVQMNSPAVRSLLPPVVSRTFHGRDVFAPLTAHLAASGSADSLGTPAAVDWLEAPFVDELRPLGQVKILHIDRFGNIVTNVAAPDGVQPPGVRGIKFGPVKIERWIENYESAPVNLPCLIVGSSGLVEIIMKRDSAAEALKTKRSHGMKILRS
jgi:S-adenosyl-L-methionine hydrolase (adenosine-forming)